MEITADPRLAVLLQELQRYPGSRNTRDVDAPVSISVAVPLRLRTEHGLLSLPSTTMVFGTPVDVTLSELAIEAFFPADAATAGLLPRITSEETRRDGEIDDSTVISRGL